MKPSFVFVSMLVLAPALLVMGCGSDETVAPDTVAPAAPNLLGANNTEDIATVWWEANTEPDLSGYYVYVTEAGVTRQVNDQPHTGNYLTVDLEGAGQALLFVTAVDFSGNESNPSSYRTVGNEIIASDDRSQREMPELK